MTRWTSVAASIALLASFSLCDSVSAGGATDSGALTSETLSAGMARTSSAPASSVGRCNALIGQALGLVHRIDHGDTGLCGQLVDQFNVFAPQCLDLLAHGQLFLSHALGEYQLACHVIRSECFVEPGPVACPFPP